MKAGFGRLATASAVLAVVIPRLILVGMWIAQDDRLMYAFGSGWTALAAGLVLPATSVGYALSWAYPFGPGTGAGWAIAVGVLIDLIAWTYVGTRQLEIGRARRRARTPVA